MKKRVFAAVLASVMVLGLAACGGSSDSSSSGSSAAASSSKEASAASSTSEAGEAASSDKPGEGIVIGVTDMAANEMSVAYEALLQENCDRVGAEMVYYTSNSSVDEQIKQLEDLTTRGVDVIFIRPVDNNGVEGGLVTVQQAGIPLIFEEYDENLEDYVTCFDLAMNHYGYGVAQAEDLIARLEADPDLVAHCGILWGMKGLLPAQQRRDGFVETIQDYIDAGRVTIEDEQSMEGDITKLQGIVEDWFSSHPEIDTYVCPNDEMAMTVIACLDSANKSYDNIRIYGMDASAAALAYIQEGKMTATVSRNMPAEAENVINLCVKVAKGEPVDKVVDFGIIATTVTSENVDEFIASKS